MSWRPAYIWFAILLAILVEASLLHVAARMNPGGSSVAPNLDPSRRE